MQILTVLVIRCIKIPFVQHSRHYQNLRYLNLDPHPHTLDMHIGRKKEAQQCFKNDNNPL